MEDDATLLRRFVTDGADPAFGELVRRHIDFVYTSALRQAGGNRRAAENIVQHVFTRLAREAAKLPQPAALAGWLCAATRISARENSGSDRAGPGTRAASVDWRDWVDEAMDELPEIDRSVIVLRFLEHRSMAEVGRALELGEDGARIRVDRALGKLRGLLGKHGAVATDAEIAAGFDGEAIERAPAGLANGVADVALTEVAASSESKVLILSLKQFFNSTTALSAAAAVAVVAALAWGHRTNTALQAEIARLRGENLAMAGIQRDIRRLSRAVDEADNLRREIAELPSLRATVAVAPAGPPVGTASITLLGDGVIRWDRENITIRDFVRRLQEFRAQFPAAESLVVVHGRGASLPALAYVIDETRKAQIKRILVDGEVKPDPMAGGWF